MRSSGVRRERSTGQVEDIDRAVAIHSRQNVWQHVREQYGSMNGVLYRDGPHVRLWGIGHNEAVRVRTCRYNRSVYAKVNIRMPCGQNVNERTRLSFTGSI